MCPCRKFCFVLNCMCGGAAPTERPGQQIALVPLKKINTRAKKAGCFQKACLGQYIVVWVGSRGQLT